MRSMVEGASEPRSRHFQGGEAEAGTGEPRVFPSKPKHTGSGFALRASGNDDPRPHDISLGSKRTTRWR